MKSKYKILVVNRDEELSERMKKGKETGHYSIEVAKTAAVALEKIKADKYHVVLIDTDMPDKNGIELLKEIKTYDCMAQVIMTSNNSTMEQIFDSMESGANDYITDPLLNLEELTNMIKYSVEKLERWRKSIIGLVK